MKLVPIFVSAAALIGCANAPAPKDSLIVRGDRLFVPITIGGAETEALLDSAAEATFVDAAFARRIGLATAGADVAKGTGGSEEVTFAEGVAIDAVGVELADLTVAVLDLSGISQRLIGAPLTVVLGRELFDAARLDIDIEGGSIASVSRSKTPPGMELPLNSEHGLELFTVLIEGRPAAATFDLGNGSEALVGAKFAAAAGLDAPDRIVGAKSGGGIGGEVTRKLVRLKEIEIAGTPFADVEASIDETETADDANVGVRLLRNFRITVDYAEHKLWLEPREAAERELRSD